MQSPSSPANQYLANKVMTASPQELTLMLYDGCIKFLNRALIAIDNEEIEEAHKSLVKAQNIIEEFMIVVDRKIEIGNNLFLLYDYMYRRLVEANIKKDKDITNEVLGLIRELRDSWKIAMDKSKGIYHEPVSEAPVVTVTSPADLNNVPAVSAEATGTDGEIVSDENISAENLDEANINNDINAETNEGDNTENV